MTSSGTEASMSAIRLARAATGRDPILKFSGAYHGHVDGLLADAGSGLATQGIPASPGRDQGAGERHRDRPLERPRRGRAGAATSGRPPRSWPSPRPANMGLVPPADGFLEFLREAADQCGALLIFDEVISGFRVARGGMQERSGVTPDLTILGKVIGGGLPAAAYAGRARPDGADRPGRRRLPGRHAVRQPAGGRGRPGDAASCWTTPPTRGSRPRPSGLADGIAAAAAEAGVAVQVPRLPGLFTVFFSDAPVTDYERRPGRRRRRLRRLLPRAARARGLPARVAVRGLVPVAGPRRPSTSSARSRRPPRRSRAL